MVSFFNHKLLVNVHVVGKFFGSNNWFIFMACLQFQISTDEVNFFCGPSAQSNPLFVFKENMLSILL